MSTTLERFREIKEHIDKLKAQARDEAKVAFKEGTDLLFASHPELQAFGWTQYTPYFMDGDECIFGRNEIGILLTSTEVEDAETLEERISEFRSDYYSYESPEDHSVITDAINEFMNIFDDEDFKDMFGDHVNVLVTAQGVSTDDHSHD